MNAALRAPLSAALGVLLAVAALAGGPGGALPVAVVSLLLVGLVAVGWPSLLELPSARGTRIVLVLVGFGAVAVAALSPAPQLMHWTAMVLAGGVFAAFMHEMLRRERPRLAESITGTVTGAALVGTAGGWVAGSRFMGDADVLVSSSAALAVASFALALPVRGVIRVPLASAGAVLAAGLIAHLDSDRLPLGVVLGVLVAAVTTAVHYLLTRIARADEASSVLATAAAPALLLGMVAFFTVRLGDLAGTPLLPG